MSDLYDVLVGGQQAGAYEFIEDVARLGVPRARDVRHELACRDPPAGVIGALADPHEAREDLPGDFVTCQVEASQGAVGRLCQSSGDPARGAVPGERERLAFAAL